MQNGANIQQARLDPGVVAERVYITPDDDTRPESLTVLRSGDTMTYLLPIGYEGARTPDKINAVRGVGGIAIRFLPPTSDTYALDERRFAQKTLGLGANELASPFVHEAQKDQALVFDPTSAKSVVDVLIAAGHDTSTMRQARRAAMQGEANEFADTLSMALFLADANTRDDERAAAFRAAYDINMPDSLQLVEELVVHADPADDHRLHKLAQTMLLGIRPQRVEQAVAAPESLQAEISEAWREAAALAVRNNRDVQKNGAYVELHKIGNTLLPLVALTDTTGYYDASADSLGYVSIDGGGHTLSEIYADIGPENWHLPQRIFDMVRGSKMYTLARELGVLHRSTLERRCLMTLDEKTGEPVVHLEENPLYSSRNRMSDERLWHALQKLGIASDARTREGEVLDLAAEIDKTPVTVHIQEDYRYERTDKSPQIPVGYLSGGTATKLRWNVGYTKYHKNLWADAYAEDENAAQGITKITFGGDEVGVRALYVGTDTTNGKHQSILWQLYGDPATIRAFSGRVRNMVGESNLALAAYMKGAWGVMPDALTTEISINDEPYSLVT